MGGIKGWLQNLADKVNSTSVLGQGHRVELLETIEYQRVSLVQQHESLGVIVLYLVKANYSIVADFEQLLDIVKKADKYDNLLGKFTSFQASEYVLQHVYPYHVSCHRFLGPSRFE